MDRVCVEANSKEADSDSHSFESWKKACLERWGSTTLRNSYGSAPVKHLYIWLPLFTPKMEDQGLLDPSQYAHVYSIYNVQVHDATV